MSRDLVTLQQAQNHLRRDEDQIGQPDADLSAKISAASELILQYLKGAAAMMTDTSGEVPQNSQGDPLGVPDNVRAATLIMVGYLDVNRDDDKNDGFAEGRLPSPVRALLGTIRVPTLR